MRNVTVRASRLVWPRQAINPAIQYPKSCGIRDLDYIHQNPVRRGYVERPEHWRYSSARDYQGQPGLIGIDRWI